MERFPTYLYQKYPDAPKPSISGIGDNNAVPESQSILPLRIGIECIYIDIDKYRVTPVTHQALLLVSKRTGEHTICIGPILINQNLTKHVYADFVYCIQKNCPGLKDELRAFGTDGEKPLEQSLSEGFPCAIKLRCMSHLRNNVKEHLKVLDGSNKNKITNQIFVYHTVDGIYTDEGMVDAYGQPLPPKIQTRQTV